MSISRRDFIKLGGASAFAGVSLLSPVLAVGQKTVGTLDSLPREVLDDPLFSLTASDFKKYIGTEFSVFSEKGGAAAVLLNVTEAEAGRNPSRVRSRTRRSSTAENYTLSFRLPMNGFSQSTYRLKHSNLGEFDMFLVPEAGDKFLLHAVINRI